MQNEEIIKDKDAVEREEIEKETQEAADIKTEQECGCKEQELDCENKNEKRSWLKKLPIFNLDQPRGFVTKTEAIVMFLLVIAFIIAGTLTIAYRTQDSIDQLSNKMNTTHNIISSIHKQNKEVFDKVNELAQANVANKTPFLGVGFDTKSPSQNSIGLMIDVVYENAPADLAGLEVGDVIVSICGENVQTLDDASSIIASHRVGDAIEIKVARIVDGKIVSIDINATLANRENFDIG